MKYLILFAALSLAACHSFRPVASITATMQSFQWQSRSTAILTLKDSANNIITFRYKEQSAYRTRFKIGQQYKIAYDHKEFIYDSCKYVSASISHVKAITNK